MASRYHEVVIEGAKGRSYGFMEGFLVGRGLAGRIYNMEREGFDCESLRERVAELFSPSEEIYHLLVGDNERAALHEAETAARERKLNVKILEERPVGGARFEFQFRIYSPPHAERIRDWFDKPPEGVGLSDETRFEEILDSEAKGMESFAPAHEFELRAEGVVSGDVEGVIDLYRRCRREELVQIEALEVL